MMILVRLLHHPSVCWVHVEMTISCGDHSFALLTIIVSVNILFLPPQHAQRCSLIVVEDKIGQWPLSSRNAPLAWIGADGAGGGGLHFAMAFAVGGFWNHWLDPSARQY